MNVHPSVFYKFRKAVRSFNDDERGVVLVLGAVLIPVLLFAAGLVIDAGFALQNRLKAQLAADLAAVAGAQMLATQNKTLSDAQNEALAVAAKNGFSTGVQANRPGALSPPLGRYTNGSTYNRALEVRIAAQWQNIFGRIFNILTLPINVRAVANAAPTAPCIVTLNTLTTGAYSSTSGVNLNGVNASLIIPCGIYIDSPDSSRALDANTGTNRVCASLSDVNQISVISMQGNSTGQYRSGVCPGVDIKPNQAYVPNPYAYLNPTSSATAVASFSWTRTGGSNPGSGTGTINSGNGAFQNIQTSGGSLSYTISPGNYPNGISISGISSLNFESGLYYIGSSGLDISSVTNVNASPAGGVTIALTDRNAGTVEISGTTNFNQTAMNSGAYSGFAVVQAPPTTPGASVTTGGTQGNNAVWNVNGIVVMPNTNLGFQGGNSSSNNCSGFISWTMTIGGGTSIVDGCQNIGNNTTGLSTPLLVE